MSDLEVKSPLEETVIIVGVGLIGGSIAAAVKRRNVARRVIGVGRNAERLQAAEATGLIDEISTDLAEVANEASFVVFCTPVDQVVAGVRIAADAIPRESTTVLTDAGSVKTPICHELADVQRFVGAHPIAGSHRQGYEAADPNLFQDRVCVITPLEVTKESYLSRVERFWRAIGMQTVTLTPEAHDRSLAMTSHLPHLVAAALATTLEPGNQRFVGTGFRDTTRIAAGDPDLWTAILHQNAGPVCAGLDVLLETLGRFREALTHADLSTVRSLLAEGQQARAALDPN